MVKQINFKALTTDFSTFNLTEVKTRYQVIASVPSLCTSVCQVEYQDLLKLTQRFPHIAFIIVSRDLPFGIDAFLKQHQHPARNWHVVSDAKDHDFGLQTGLVDPKTGLLQRAVLVVNHKHEVCYQEVTPTLPTPINLPALEAFLAKHC